MPAIDAQPPPLAHERATGTAATLPVVRAEAAYALACRAASARSGMVAGLLTCAELF
jgi:hypothetical protein